MLKNTFFTKIIVSSLILISTSLLSQEITISDDIKDYTSELGKYTTAASAIETSLKVIYDLSSKNNALESIKSYNKIVKSLEKYRDIPIAFKSDTELFKRVNEVRLFSEKLENLSKAKMDKLNKIDDIVDTLDVPLKTIGVCLSAYSMYENFNNINLDGSIITYKNSESFLLLGTSAYDTLVGVAEISSLIAKSAPKRVVAKYLAENALSKSLLNISRTTAMETFGVISIGASIESMVYQSLRDKKINTIKNGIFSLYTQRVNDRERILKELFSLYQDSEINSSSISLKSIDKILNNYLVVHVEYGAVNQGDTISLIELYNNLLRKESDLSKLSNFEKIGMAIEALAQISTYEDFELLGYLSSMIDEEHTAADIIFSALEGSSIYEIYDTEDLKNRMFPYRESGMVAQEYYRTIYGILFNGTVSETKLQKEAILGKKIADILLRKKLEEEKIANMEKIYLILQGSATVEDGTITTKIGDKIEMIFTDASAKSYSDFIKEAFQKSKKIVLWYQDLETNTRESIVLKVDSLGYTDGFYPLYFNAKTTKFQPISISYFDDNLGGYTTFDFRIGEYSRFDIKYDKNVNEVEDKENSLQDATKIAKKIGNHLISKTKIDFSSSDSFLVNDNLFITENYGIRVMDVSDKKDPKQITDFKIGSRNSPYSAKLNYPYIFYKNSDTTHIVDISDPKNLVEINKTKEIESSIKNFYQGYAYTDKAEIFKVSDPNDIRKLSNMDVNLSTIESMKISIKYPIAYTYGYADSQKCCKSGPLVFKTLSLKNPAIPTSLGTIQIEDYYLSGDIVITENYAVVVAMDQNEYINNAIYKYGLLFIDITDENNPKIERFYPLDFRPDCSVRGTLSIENNLLYILDYSSLKIYDIKDISNIQKINDTPFQIGSYAGEGDFIVDRGFIYSVGQYILQIFDVTNPTAQNEHYFYSNSRGNINSNISKIAKKSNYIYLNANKLKKDGSDYERVDGFNVVNLTDKSNPKFNFIEAENNGHNNIIHNNYLFTTGSDGVIVYDISNPNAINKLTTLEANGGINFVDDRYIVIGNILYEQDSFKKLGTLPIDEHRSVYIKDNLLYSNNIYDISDMKNIKKVSELLDDQDDIEDIYIKDNTLFVSLHCCGGTSGLRVYDITNPKKPLRLSNIPVGVNNYEFKIKENLIFVNAGPSSYGGGGGGVYIYDISDPKNPKKLYYRYLLPKNIEVDDTYLYLNMNGGLHILNWRELIDNELVRNNYYYPEKNIFLTDESPKDYEVKKDKFIKRWEFSEVISSYDVEVLSYSYNSYYKEKLSFQKNGNILSVELTPNLNNKINELKLRLKDDKGNIIKINNSDTFWSITKTNYLPRFEDGQLTQMVSSTKEPAFLEIKTFDADGDRVKLTIEDDAGGYIGFSKDDPNRLFASFDDNKTFHTIKIGLDDGKEKVIKELNVLQFDENSIENFYSDVKKDANDYPYDGIYFGTLKGVLCGQPDSSDSQKRVFKPKDNATVAEALAMVILSEKKAGLIELETTDMYKEIEPAWAMPYYTYAVDSGALDVRDDIAYSFITREEVAKLVVKSLNLDTKIKDFDLNITFSDEDKFSSPQYLYYAKVAKYFGLFMNENSARAKEFIKRADLAVVIEKIFMLPIAKLNLNPNSGEYGESFSYELKDINAQKISSDGTEIVDNSENLKSYILINKRAINQKTVNNKILNIGDNKIYTILENSGVRNILETIYRMDYYDDDVDGVENREDVWKEDARYAFDDNNNGIPDILDFIYDLGSYKATDTITINNQKIFIKDIIEYGMIPEDINKDSDADGYADDIDAFPNNPNEYEDTDKDGVGDNADTDDDNDGISDEDEVKYGLNPKDNSDANKDSDGDGVTNINEIRVGTNPNKKDITDKQLFISKGWNLLSLSSRKDINCSEFKDATIIWKYDNNTSKWMVYTQDKSIRDTVDRRDDIKLFDSIKAGEGFWLNSSKNELKEF